MEQIIFVSEDSILVTNFLVTDYFIETNEKEKREKRKSIIMMESVVLFDRKM